MKMTTERQNKRVRSRWQSCAAMVATLLVCGGLILAICVGFKYLYKRTGKTTLHCPYTYKIGHEDAEYVTFERVGEKSYKISFLPTPEYSEADYVVITNNLGWGYPTLMWSYLTGEKRQIFLSNHDAGSFWVDTVVSHHYEFLINHDILRNDTVKTLDDIERANEWSAALWERPYKYRAYTKEFNTIGYKDPTAKTYLDYKDAEVVR